MKARDPQIKKKFKEKVIINTKFTQYSVISYISKDLKYRIFNDKMNTWGKHLKRHLLVRSSHDVRLLPTNEDSLNRQPVPRRGRNLPQK